MSGNYIRPRTQSSENAERGVRQFRAKCKPSQNNIGSYHKKKKKLRGNKTSTFLSTIIANWPWR